MSSTVTKFEIYATNTQRQDPAWATFQTSVATLAGTDFYYQVSTIDSGANNGQGLIMHGLLPLTNDAAALLDLGTLNTALTANSLGTVQCVSYNVTSQP
jgi:hypothetical protein